MPYKNIEDRRAYAKRHYAENKDSYIARSLASNAKVSVEVKAFLKEVKSVPCADCGVSYPDYVMDFDHLRDKTANISTWKQRGWNLARVKEEVEKCEVVCSNCHRERTFQRRKKI